MHEELLFLLGLGVGEEMGDLDTCFENSHIRDTQLTPSPSQWQEIPTPNCSHGVG